MSGLALCVRGSIEKRITMTSSGMTASCTLSLRASGQLGGSLRYARWTKLQSLLRSHRELRTLIERKLSNEKQNIKVADLDWWIRELLQSTLCCNVTDWPKYEVLCAPRSENFLNSWLASGDLVHKCRKCHQAKHDHVIPGVLSTSLLLVKIQELLVYFHRKMKYLSLQLESILIHYHTAVCMMFRRSGFIQEISDHANHSRILLYNLPISCAACVPFSHPKLNSCSKFTLMLSFRSSPSQLLHKRRRQASTLRLKNKGSSSSLLSSFLPLFGFFFGHLDSPGILTLKTIFSYLVYYII